MSPTNTRDGYLVTQGAKVNQYNDCYTLKKFEIFLNSENNFLIINEFKPLSLLIGSLITSGCVGVVCVDKLHPPVVFKQGGRDGYERQEEVDREGVFGSPVTGELNEVEEEN